MATSILQQLENNEAILLMYLADELPSEDRLEVEQMLRKDGGLRDLLERLRETQQAGMSILGELDAATPLPDEDGAVRRLMRNLRKRQLELAARPAAAPPLPLHKRMPAWAYPIISVAAVIIIALGLWGIGVFDFGVKGSGGDQIVVDTTDPEPLNLIDTSPNASLDEAHDRLHQLRQDDEDNDKLVLMTF